MRTDRMTRVMYKSARCALLLGGIGLIGGTQAAAQDGIPAGPEQTTTARHADLNSAGDETLNSEVIRVGNERTGTRNAYYDGTCDQTCDGLCDGACGECGCDGGRTDPLADFWGADEPVKLFGTTETGVEIGGWMEFGYLSDPTGLFTQGGPGVGDEDDKLNLNQWWLYMERKADGSDGLDWGFRFDAMYGTDAQDTQAFGNDPGEWDFVNGFDHGIYGFALPQAYGELAYGDLSVKLGHFFTIVGYEVVTAPDNFFFSHAFTMFNSEPFTHTGALATYSMSDNVELYGGWTAGWDTGFDEGSDDNGSNFLGGGSFGLTDDLTLTYITTAGEFGARGNGYSHSIVLEAQLTEKWEYVFQSDLVGTNGGATPGVNNDQVGINQYLFYDINDCLAAGTRWEWWKNDGNSLYAMTYGVNIKPHPNFTLRPEVRYQWSPHDRGVVGFPVDETIAGFDAILTY